MLRSSGSDADHPELQVCGLAACLDIGRRRIIVILEGGREVSADVDRYRRLGEAELSALLDFELISGGYGVQWPQLDEDPSVYAMVRDCGLLDERGRLRPVDR